MEEPKINVGIMEGEVVEFALGEGVWHRAAADGGVVMIDGEKVECPVIEPEGADGCFWLKGVTIGVNFHWERRENQRFKGTLKFIVKQGDPHRVIAVNDVGVEDYLKSVISSEMSAGASEALLMAHAVISRSWLLRQLRDRGKHRVAEVGGWHLGEVDGCTVDELVRWYDREDHTQFDVCADDHCQRYQGVTRQTSPAVEQAVEATRGMVLMWNGEICDARFSKCCGGKSERFENCWEDVEHPYLDPVDDREPGGDRDFCDTDDEEVLSLVLNSYDLETKDFYQWRVEYDKDELGELIARRSGLDLGRIEELRPLQRGESGRIKRLFIKGEKRSVIIGKELEIRRWLSESHLKSSAFEVVDRGDSILIEGKGWGHGVGLCQIGAAVMGAEGYGYEEILKHYFPKAELRKIYG